MLAHVHTVAALQQPNWQHNGTGTGAGSAQQVPGTLWDAARWLNTRSTLGRNLLDTLLLQLLLVIHDGDMPSHPCHQP
jgi:hypothetical protein